MYKHWKNVGQPLDMVFFTTTVLDFVPVFKRTELADEMARNVAPGHTHAKERSPAACVTRCDQGVSSTPSVSIG